MIAAKDLPFPDFTIPSNPNPPIPSITVRPVKSTPSTPLASAPDDCSTCVNNSMMSVPAFVLGFVPRLVHKLDGAELHERKKSGTLRRCA
ncbi:hypothetical protein BGZ59_011488 [Podila verticillata]|nr:hypothetical protein BGZ59_011488 [Podila verticillata]